MTSAPRISIVTPSFRSGEWLKLCIASVADQRVALEHIVQDSQSDDGTADWLPQDGRVRAFIEKDRGMYDAINRGLKRATGEVLGWLNCDEQYLPRALNAVDAFFRSRTDIDVLFGDVIMTGSDGEYLAHRKMQVPLKYHTWTCHLSTLSCAMFFRRRLLFERGFWFNPELRDGGDGEWMVRLLRAGVAMATLGEFTSVFTQTGANMSAAPNALRENHRLFKTAPAWARAAKPLFILQHRLRRLLGGMYQQGPFSYEIYTRNFPEARQCFSVERPRSTTPRATHPPPVASCATK